MHWPDEDRETIEEAVETQEQRARVKEQQQQQDDRQEYTVEDELLALLGSVVLFHKRFVLSISHSIRFYRPVLQFRTELRWHSESLCIRRMTLILDVHRNLEHLRSREQNPERSADSSSPQNFGAAMSKLGFQAQTV